MCRWSSITIAVKRVTLPSRSTEMPLTLSISVSAQRRRGNGAGAQGCQQALHARALRQVPDQRAGVLAAAAHAPALRA